MHTCSKYNNLLCYAIKVSSDSIICEFEKFLPKGGFTGQNHTWINMQLWLIIIIVLRIHILYIYREGRPPDATNPREYSWYNWQRQHIHFCNTKARVYVRTTVHREMLQVCFTQAKYKWCTWTCIKACCLLSKLWLILCIVMVHFQERSLSRPWRIVRYNHQYHNKK